MGTIVRSALIVLAIASAVGGATTAYFSDSETSRNNTFTAGTLDLSVDGENPLASAKFSVADFVPGAQQSGTYRLVNNGTIDGFLDIASVIVVSAENGCNEPESEAGDVTCGTPGDGEGELAQMLEATLFFDDDCDGVRNGGESAFYEGFVGSIPQTFDLNHSISAGMQQCVTALFVWNSGANDNRAQGDSVTLDIAFEIAQTTAQ